MDGMDNSGLGGLSGLVDAVRCIYSKLDFNRFRIDLRSSTLR